MKELLSKAIALAARAHRDQEDRLGEPYILHPLAVMASMDTNEARIVAVLHDTVEDTDTTLKTLWLSGFPDNIIDAVDAISKRDGEKNVDYYERVKQNPLALKVKLADIAHNTSPARIGYLDNETRDRLEKKYKKALDILK